VHYCKSRRWPTKAQKRAANQRRSFGELLSGMELGKCQFLSLVNPDDYLLSLRNVVWHNLLTRIRQVWPDAAAATSYEDDRFFGPHLHVVVRDAPGLEIEWLQQLANRALPGTSVVTKLVHDPRGMSGYLVKQLGNARVMDGWPRHFRVVTYTRNWLPKRRRP